MTPPGSRRTQEGHGPVADARLYGLRLRVPDRVASLLPRGPEAEWDLELTLANTPPAEKRGEAYYATCACVVETEGLQLRALGGDAFEFWFGDGTWVRVNVSDRSLEAFTPNDSTVEDTMTYVTGPVLGFALRRFGLIGLHASAVEVGGRAVAFLGASGAGKSTTAAALALSGVPLVTEDLLALTVAEDRITAHTGFPSIRLWRDSADMLGTPPLAAVTMRWGKLTLPATTGSDSLPLGAIFLLASHSGESSSRSEIHPVAPAASLLELIRSVYVPHLAGAADQGAELPLLARVAERVPIYRLAVARPPRAPELLDVIGGCLPW